MMLMPAADAADATAADAAADAHAVDAASADAAAVGAMGTVLRCVGRLIATPDFNYTH